MVAGVAVTFVHVVLVALAAEPAPRVDAIAGSPAVTARPVEAGGFVPPEPIETPSIPYPEGAPGSGGMIDVEVVILIDTTGNVERVELRRPAGPPFDAAVLAGVTHFRFEPARFEGEPVPVEITYTQHFVPPAPEAQAEGEETGRLAGLVQERGTSRPLVRAAVVATTEAGDERVVTTDETGRFSVDLPEGTWDIRVVAEGYRKFRQIEVIRVGAELRVRYLVLAERYSPYEAIVIGKRERTEVSRTTLRDQEIRNVPGTFGDPFRVVSTLPGVTDVIGPLVPLPVVRGSSPGNTGFLLDGMRVPLLFHLFAGPAVIHPEFFDHLDFYPGGFGVQYGGYIGGVVDGKTRAARASEQRLELNLTQTQSGLFVRRELPFGGLTTTAAGRVGYPGYLIRLANPDISLSYWDYQARVDARSGDDRLSVFVYGAHDEIKTRPEDELGNPDRNRPLERSLLFRFHRLDARYRDINRHNQGSYRIAVTTEAFQLGDIKGKSLQLAPELRWRFDLTDRLVSRVGVEGAFDRVDASFEPEETGSEFTLVPTEWLSSAGLYTDLIWRPSEALQLVPGVRADWYHADRVDAYSVDPRVLARFRVRDVKNERIWLKAAVGWYHQPPRLFLSLPVLRTTDLGQGLLAAVHTMLGSEIEIGRDATVDVQAYFNAMDPVFQELSTSQSVSDILPQTRDAAELRDPDDGPLTTDRTVGRSFGFELLVRRHAGEDFFGWLAYTFSFSQRRFDGEWVAFDHDRRHIVNAVAGVLLPRNWELGLRLSLQSGPPVTTVNGYNAGRAEPQMRIDLRMDKRAVWNEWMLDFYVDIINVAVTREAVGLGGEAGFRYILPTLGLRAVL